MDGNIDKVREALVIKIGHLAIDCGFKGAYTFKEQAVKFLTTHDEAIRRETLIEAKVLIQQDKETFEHVGRKTLGHARALMLIDEYIGTISQYRAAILGTETIPAMLPETKSSGGANTLAELMSLLEIARDNKTGISLDWVETGIALRNLSEPAQDDGEPDATATEQEFSDKWCAYWKDFWLKSNYPVITESSRPKNWDTANDIYEIVDKIR